RTDHRGSGRRPGRLPRGQHPMSTLIGTGRLSWAPHERRSDRYGTVLLMVDGDSWTEPKAYVDLDQAHVGQHGALAAEVVETRDSTHIGDVFRNMYPETPEVGDVIVLGAGTVFFESTDWGATAVG